MDTKDYSRKVTEKLHNLEVENTELRDGTQGRCSIESSKYSTFVNLSKLLTLKADFRDSIPLKNKDLKANLLHLVS
eukprot:snap_masked-scaffold_13-processed-gene-11.20-mRNA-1 protein AED:1.00 eAED:1.00 QI:0/-1/0/0/-1/1/1/0/75